MKIKYGLLIIPLLLSACGWQLRNAQVVPEDLGTLYISAHDPHSDLVNDLKRALNTFGVKVVDNPASANYSVVLVDFRRDQRTATVNSDARAAEFQLNEEVDFLILGADGTQIVPLSTASVERVYDFNERDVLASNNEGRLVFDEMRNELVRQILNRLRIVPGTQASENEAR